MSESTYLKGFFEVAGVGSVTVETPSTGDAQADYRKLALQVQALHPSAECRRVGSVFEVRGPDDEPIEVAGVTIGQLFTGEDRTEASRVIGRVLFNGIPARVRLVFLRGIGVVTLRLHPDLLSEGVVNFAAKFGPQQLATELPDLIRGVLGNAGRELKLNFK